MQELSHRVAHALARPGVRPGDKVAILSANDPIAFACVFGISRAGAVWCPINPRNEAAENRELLDLLRLLGLIFQARSPPLVDADPPDLPKITTWSAWTRRRLGVVVRRVDRVGPGRRRVEPSRRTRRRSR